MIDADCDAGPVHLNLDALHRKVEEADSRFTFPFNTETTKATLLLLISRVRGLEREVEVWSRRYDRLVDEYGELESSVTPPAEGKS